VRIFFPDTEDLPLPAGHRFPAGKYRLLREKLLAEGILAAGQLQASPAIAIGDLERAHSPAYVRSILSGSVSADAMRRIGLPWSQTLVRRSRAAVGGSLAAARSALAHGVSGQLAGGTHHAHRDHGSGFCVFNDLAVTALTLLAERPALRIAIIDLDVHQGDGNASILAARDTILVASLHAENNFPFKKIPSDFDLALPDATTDDHYLEAVEETLAAAARFHPDLVLYLAGVDPLKQDRLGRLDVTLQGLVARDRLVLGHCRVQAIPVAIVAGGGYADPISLSVDAYANTWRVARSEFASAWPRK